MNTGLQVILSVGFVIFVFLFIFQLISISVHWKNYKYYKSTYRLIKNKDIVLVRDSDLMLTYRFPLERNFHFHDNAEVLFFKDDIRNDKINSIKLMSNGLNYIHDGGGMDLYARYWFNKIMKARKENNELYAPRPFTSPDITITFKRPFKFLRG